MKGLPMPPINQQPRSHSQPTTQLTKRELIAAMALQGLLASEPDMDVGSQTSITEIAEIAIAFADALLEALDS